MFFYSNTYNSKNIKIKKYIKLITLIVFESVDKTMIYAYTSIKYTGYLY